MEERNLEVLLKRYLFGYQAAVNEGRALPFAETGLKVVHNRILWACYEGGYLSSKEYRKSARIVGDTMGKYHPHGDTAIYDALIRLAQPWKMRYPLMDVYGNMGNIDGDGPAAMRYTNSRLSKLAEEGLLLNIKKRNVDFVPNYDEDDEEPVTLPAIFPNLLCNPNEGIGWAMACEWLPHNLKEVAKAIFDYLDGKTPMLPGPDFPNGGQIINMNDMEKCYLTGKGTVRIRAKYKINKNDIIFYEIPFGTTTEAIIQKIQEVAKAELPEVRDVVNEEGLTVKCANGSNLAGIVTKLFAKTPLQTTASFNQVALVNGKPKLINLKECIEIYISHNIGCIIREAEFDLEKAKARLHIVDGLLKALEDIDNIIALIKKSENAAAAKEALIAKYSFTDIQAKAILDMKLAKLANLEKIELQNEQKELINLIDELNALINDREKQVEELRKRLNYIVAKYGDARRTELTQVDEPKTKAEKEIVEVIPEDVVVITTQSGYIKRVPKSAFKVQHRNTKGVKSSDDAILDLVKTNTIDTMCFFTDKGKMYRCIVDKIAEGDNKSLGVPISSIINIENDERIVAVSSLHRTTTPKYVIFITKNGLLKKSLLEEYFKTNRNNGIQALKLGENDSVVDIIFMDTEDMVVITKNGMSIKFKTDSINAVGRVAVGIKAIKLNEDDEIVSAMPVHKTTDTVAIFDETGMAKRVELSEFPLQTKGGKGTIAHKGTVVGAEMISDEDLIFVCGIPSSVTISASEIPTQGKSAAGVTIIKNSIIKSVTKI